MEIKLENLTELQLESLKKQIEEFEKLNSTPKDEIDYKNGWIVDACEDARICITDDYCEYDVNNFYELGLYRSTKEQAEALVRKMKIEHRLKQWAKMCEEKADFENNGQTKWCAYCDNANNIAITSYRTNRCNDIYFTNKFILERAIEDIGKENLRDNYFVEA